MWFSSAFYNCKNLLQTSNLTKVSGFKKIEETIQKQERFSE